MFLGHFAVGLAAKKVVPEVSLGFLFIASQFLDLLWPILVLANIESVSVEPGATQLNSLNFEFYPYSHGLVMALVWSILGGGLFYIFSRNFKSSIVIALLVLSHWVLDWITHRPDLPIYFLDSTKVGLGLWNSLWGTILIEFTLFFMGIWFYLKSVHLPGRKKKAQFWSLIAFLLLIYLGNVFGPQPAEGTPGSAIAGPALAMWLIVLWAAWADRSALPKQKMATSQLNPI